MRIVLASRNPKKVKELQAILPESVEVLPVSAFPDVPEVEETGDTFEENATLKAEAVSRATGLPALADDSGLCVDALDGAPGVYSARFAGADADDAANNELLLAKLGWLQWSERTARFVCVIAWAMPGQPTELFRGETEGHILDKLRGEDGFGYDPLFYSEHLRKTFAEAAPEEKNGVSHRGRALRLFLDYFQEQY